ncbi:DnaJ-domain-containing protein [Coprinopsis marcescibilis]|uniref:DnaJ-domain-containing protein n=1 Tax=Coprinopsis marcescibilis TaxID=230819 RepID=A0A5C3KKD7_COPMA|nr:DnaJ-domain-containing protein [Coprinopsis marcescibilis]
MVLTKETFTFDPRPYYPLLIKANRYWDPKTQAHDGLTMVFAHGTSFNKETWEPTIEDLQVLVESQPSKLKIREFWSIEAPNHGDSAALNQEVLRVGYTPIFGWEEYARSIHLFLSGYGSGVNVDFSKHNLVGVGHSMGAVSMVLMAGHHPRVKFKAVIFCELMIMAPTFGKAASGMLTGGAENRRDTWPSKEEAYKILKSRGTWKQWDDRVLKGYVETGLKPLDNGEGVTLKCTREQEAACYRDPLGSSRAYGLLTAYVKQVPTHLIYGEINDYLPAEVKEDILVLVGGVQNLESFSLVPKAGHLILPIAIPPTPTTYKTPSAPSTSRLSAPHPSGHRSLLQVGPAYINHLRLSLHHAHSFTELDKHLEAERERHAALNPTIDAQEDDLGVGEEEEPEELLTLDPKEWKKHDLYAVLGLSHLRYRATAEQIKIAHRKKVLKHHPDKKASATPGFETGVQLNTNDDAFFKCIQKAHEVLTNAEKRRQFDSVDPQFMELEEYIPTAAATKSKNFDFFKEFSTAFDLFSRFSKTQPVPGLGGVDASKQEVEAFYDFWYNFDSWRSFEWLDKEVNEGSDSRDDKRYTEKKNKTERARRKKEDTTKLRGLVDLALSIDPRIKRIKQQEKEAREAKKKAAAPNVPAKKTKQEEEAEKKRLEEEAKAKEEAEKAVRADAKKAKAAAANAAKKARRQQRATEET